MIDLLEEAVALDGFRYAPHSKIVCHSLEQGKILWKWIHRHNVRTQNDCRLNLRKKKGTCWW